jgi:hypothetical protein
MIHRNRKPPEAIKVLRTHHGRCMDSGRYYSTAVELKRQLVHGRSGDRDGRRDWEPAASVFFMAASSLCERWMGAPNLRFKAELPFAPPTGTSCWAGPVGVSSLVFFFFFFSFFYFCFPFLKFEQFNISKFVHSPIFIKSRIWTKFRIWVFNFFNNFRIWTILEIWTIFEFEQFSNFEQISNLNKIRIWTIFKFEQISNLNNFRILKKFWIWTNLDHEPISNLNNFRMFEKNSNYSLFNFENCSNLKKANLKKFQTQNCSNSKIVKIRKIIQIWIYSNTKLFGKRKTIKKPAELVN